MKKLQKNSISLGLLLALLLPVMVTAVFLAIFGLLDFFDLVSSEGFRPLFRERTAAIAGIASNAVLLNYHSKLKNHETVRGVVIITTFWVIAWMAIFGKHVL